MSEAFTDATRQLPDAAMQGAVLIWRTTRLYRDMGVLPDDGSSRGKTLADMEAYLRKHGVSL